MRIKYLLVSILVIPIFACSNSAEDYITSGLNDVEKADYKAALVKFNKAIELDQNNSGYYILRGITKNNLCDYVGALADFDNAINIDPNESTAYYNRANSHYELGNYQASINDYTKAIEVSQGDPYINYAHYYSSRSQAKKMINDSEGSTIDYNKYLELTELNQN